jgi:hypothetical protein
VTCRALGRVRPRPSTKAFDAVDGREFDFFLAEKLGMTVARMQVEMSALEHLRWWVYYGREAQRKEIRGRQGNHKR